MYTSDVYQINRFWILCGTSSETRVLRALSLIVQNYTSFMNFSSIGFLIRIVLSGVWHSV